MKKIVSSVLVCVMLLGCIFALASCAKQLNGTYKSDELLGSYTTFTFEGNKVSLKLTVMGFTSDKAIEGTYKIEDGKIAFDFGDNEDADDFSEPMDFEEATDYIKIGGTTYFKQK